MERIVEVGITRVVMGVREPTIYVNCTGVEWLLEKNVIVKIVPNMKNDCLKACRNVVMEYK